MPRRACGPQATPCWPRPEPEALNIPDLAGQLHAAVAWGLLPLAALVAAGGALRPELSRTWRTVLALGSTCAAAAVGLLAARHGLNHLHVPWWVLLLAPPMCIVWAYGARDSKPLMLLCAAGFAVSLMLWVLLGLRALGGTTAVLLAHDALLVIAAPLLIVGLCKQLATPRPAPPPAPDEPSLAEREATTEASREAAVQQRLASPEAQEAADKYTRD